MSTKTMCVVDFISYLLGYLYRSPASQPKRELERSLEALNKLDLSETDTKKQSRPSDASHKEALVVVIF